MFANGIDALSLASTTVPLTFVSCEKSDKLIRKNNMRKFRYFKP
jgi:hypothetical protein